MNKQNRNLLIDIALFGGFILAFFLDLTGVVAHQWLGAALGALAGLHLVLHWNWVKAVSARLFGRTSGQARLYYLVDAALLLGMGMIVASGLVISTWLDLPLADYALWRDAHVFVSVASLVILVSKILLHERWVANAIQKLLAPRWPAARPALQPAALAASATRREFLSVAGVTSLAAVIAIGSVLKDPEALAASASSDSASSQASAASNIASGAVSSQSSSSASTACRVRCNKGCSYPGRCKRYVDSNSNKKCDLGECL